MRKLKVRRTIERAATGAAILFCVASVLPAGGMLAGSLFWINVSGLILGALTTLIAGTDRERRIPPLSLGPLFLLLALTGVAVFQLVELSPSLLQTLSPGSAMAWAEANELLGETRFVWAIWSSISLTPDETFHSLFTLLATIGCFVMGAVLFGSARRRKALLGSLSILAITQALHSLLSERGPAIRLSGNFVNPNHFAGYLLIPVCIAFAFSIEGIRGAIRRRIWLESESSHFLGLFARSTGWLFVWLLLAGTLALTKSRGGITAATLVLLGMLGLSLAESRLISRGKKTSLGIASGIAFAIAFLVLTVGTEAISRFLAWDPADLPRDSRVLMWKASWEAAGEFPFFGAGLGCFLEAFRKFQPAEIVTSVEQAHNDYVHLFLSVGLVGFLLAMAAALLTAIRLIGIWSHTEDRWDSAYLFGVLGGTGALALHSAVEFNLAIPAISMTAALLLGSAFATQFQTARQAHGTQPPGNEGTVRPHAESGGPIPGGLPAPRKTLFLDEVAIALFLVFSLTLCVVTYWFVYDWKARSHTQDFARRFGIAERYPEHYRLSAGEPAADFEAAILLQAAIDDVVRPVDWNSLDPAARSTWLAAMEELPLELFAAHELSLQALAGRPAWAPHRFQTARIGYFEWKLGERERGARGDPEDWLIPAALAMKAAPGIKDYADFFVAAGLDEWNSLPASWRGAVLLQLRSTLLRPQFTSKVLSSVIERLGAEKALSLVPDSAPALQAAIGAYKSSGDLPGLFRLTQRWERAELRTRAEDLESLEEIAATRNRDALRLACAKWVADHPPRDFGSPEALRQLARVLELWPAEGRGDWRRDPRANIIRLFLDGRTQFVPGSILRRALSDLEGVPDSVKARAAVLGGSGRDVRAFLQENEGLLTADAVPFLQELAKAALDQGDLKQAAEALDQLPRGSAGECGSLLLQRILLERRPPADGKTRREVQEKLSLLRPFPMDLSQGHGKGQFTACIDPVEDEKRSLLVEVSSSGPSIVQYGWNSARTGTVFVQDSAIISIPLAGIAGRTYFFVKSAAGAPVQLVSCDLSPH